MYILVTGVPPFDGEDNKAILSTIAKGKYSLTSKYKRYLVPEMEPVSLICKHLIKKMLKPADERITID